MLIFSKYFYLASLDSYLTFYLIEKFHVSAQSAQIHLFVFPRRRRGSARSSADPIGDRFGRKYVIWFSILGVLPFTLLLPYADLFWTGVLSVVIGLILASAFSAILVYAQELVPGKVGMIAGLFFGFAFGMGGLGAALLGSSPTREASSSSMRCARSCRRWDCSRRCCRICAQATSGRGLSVTYTNPFLGRELSGWVDPTTVMSSAETGDLVWAT